MTTIKSYTDLEQSKVLAKIIPMESADMYYTHGATTPDIMIGSKQDYRCYTMCWSLAALLDVLSLPDLIQDKAGDELFWQCSVYDKDGILFCETCDNNPVDACYEMILKLNELKLL